MSKILPTPKRKKIASSQNKNRLARAVLMLLGNNPTNLLLLGICAVLTTMKKDDESFALFKDIVLWCAVAALLIVAVKVILF